MNDTFIPLIGKIYTAPDAPLEVEPDVSRIMVQVVAIQGTSAQVVPIFPGDALWSSAWIPFDQLEEHEA